jgi:hypothetical protein
LTTADIPTGITGELFGDILVDPRLEIESMEAKTSLRAPAKPPFTFNYQRESSLHRRNHNPSDICARIIVNCCASESFSGSAEADFISSSISLICCAAACDKNDLPRDEMMSAEMAFPIISFRFPIHNPTMVQSRVVFMLTTCKISPILLTSPRISSDFRFSAPRILITLRRHLEKLDTKQTDSLIQLSLFAFFELLCSGSR